MKAVILAGGRGERLGPVTSVLPKPLMPIGNVPILDIVIRQLKYYGVKDVVLAVGYMAELLQAYFNDGSKYGLQIVYSKEDRPLGTAGPLALIRDLDAAFLVMNSDVLTDLDYQAMLAFHRQHKAVATIATYERQHQVDKGVVQLDGGVYLADYLEKPTFSHRVSMGIYIFEPAVLSRIPPGEFLNVPDLIQTLLKAGEKISCYPFEGYWLDIGIPHDYQKAISDFEQNKHKLLRKVSEL